MHFTFKNWSFLLEQVLWLDAVRRALSDILALTPILRVGVAVYIDSSSDVLDDLGSITDGLFQATAVCLDNRRDLNVIKRLLYFVVDVEGDYCAVGDRQQEN